MRSITLVGLLVVMLAPPARAGQENAEPSISQTIEKTRREARVYQGSFEFKLNEGWLLEEPPDNDVDFAAIPRETVHEAQGSYLTNNKARLYQVSASNKQRFGPCLPFAKIRQLEIFGDLRKSLPPVIVDQPISGYRFLSDGSVVLFDLLDPGGNRQEWTHTPHIASDNHQFTPLIDLSFIELAGSQFPLLSRMHLDFQGCSTGSNPDELKRNEKLGNRSVSKISVRSLSLDGGKKYRLWMDLEHGAIPIQTVVTDQDDRLLWAEHHDDLRLVDQKVWLPFRRVVYVPEREGGSDQGSRILFREITLLKADLNRPDESKFVLPFPETIPITNNEIDRIYPATDRWDLNSISWDTAARGEPVPPSLWAKFRALFPEREWWQHGLFLLAIGLFGAYGLYVYNKMRRSTMDPKITKAP